MKKNGFTFAELMIVITIIGIFSAIGVTVFKGSSAGGILARKKADIDSLAQAYEATYDFPTQKYKILVDADFSSGRLPISPDSTIYSFITGPNAADKKLDGFKVCTSLDPTINQCLTDSNKCYCQTSTHKLIN